MTTIKKIPIRIGLLVSFVGAVFLLVSCMCPVVSRVPVPGSSMTAVVTADLAGCYDVQLFEHGHPIPGCSQCLGPYSSQHCSLAQVSTTSNIVTIAWAMGAIITARQLMLMLGGLSSIQMECLCDERFYAASYEGSSVKEPSRNLIPTVILPSSAISTGCPSAMRRWWPC